MSSPFPDIHFSGQSLPLRPLLCLRTEQPYPKQIDSRSTVLDKANVPSKQKNPRDGAEHQDGLRATRTRYNA